MSRPKEKPFAMPKRGEVNPFFDSRATPYVGTDNISDEDGWAGIAVLHDALYRQNGDKPNMSARTAIHLSRALGWLTERALKTRQNVVWDYRRAIDELAAAKRRYETRINRLNVAHLKNRLKEVRWEVYKEMRKLRALRKTIRMERERPRAMASASRVLAESHNEAAIRKVYIYGLVASDKPGVVEYVGQTYSPHSRLEAHRKSPMFAISHFFREAHLRGACVQMVLIEEATRESANKRESHFISTYRAAGMGRLNSTHSYYAGEANVGRAA